MAKEYKVKPTALMKKTAQILVENSKHIDKKPMRVSVAMKKAGYSSSMYHNPTRLTGSKGWKQIISSIPTQEIDLLHGEITRNGFLGIGSGCR